MRAERARPTSDAAGIDAMRRVWARGEERQPTAGSARVGGEAVVPVECEERGRVGSSVLAVCTNRTGGALTVNRALGDAVWTAW